MGVGWVYVLRKNVVYSSPSFERPLYWRTTSFERPHYSCKMLYLLYKLTSTGKPLHLLDQFQLNLIVVSLSRERDYCITEAFPMVLSYDLGRPFYL